MCWQARRTECFYSSRARWILPSAPGASSGPCRAVTHSGSRSLPQSRSGRAGLAGVNISLKKNTTAYFSQVRLRRQLAELPGLVFCLHAAVYCGRSDHFWGENRPEVLRSLSFPLGYPRNLPPNSSGLFNNRHAISTDSLLDHLTI